MRKKIWLLTLSAICLTQLAHADPQTNDTTIINGTQGNPLRLENPRIAVEIDRESGAIHSIHDKKQDALYPQTGIGFEVVTKKGIFRSEKATAVSAKAGQAELRFTGNGLNIALHYRLGAEDHFIEKWLEIKSADGKPYFLKSVALEDTRTEVF